MSISKYEFSMLSNPKCLQFYPEDYKKGDNIGIPIRNYDRIFFTDSIFSMFPYGEVFYKDSSGQISDDLFYVEGLEFKIKLGFPEETIKYKDGTTEQIGGYIEHDYIWSENQFNNVQVATSSLSGDAVFILTSKFNMSDIPLSRTFNHENSSTKKTISDILKQTILPEWGMTSKNYTVKISPESTINTISTTTGTPYLIQPNMTNRNFIKILSEYAYSKNFDTSGFYSFINCNGEFYFMTIYELLDQPAVKKFKLALDKNMAIDDRFIKEYNILHGGVPINKENYNKKFNRYTSAGLLVSESKNIHDAIKDSSSGKLLVRKQYIPTKNTTNNYFGIQEPTTGEEWYKGYKNYFYRDSSVSYRMIFTTMFDKNLVAGRTVEIDLEKQTKQWEKATEYSGKWLICESRHSMNDQGIPFSQLTISKPRVLIPSNHIFYKDFSK